MRLLKDVVFILLAAVLLILTAGNMVKGQDSSTGVQVVETLP